ncbi:MAG: hypothetical protein QOJ65_759, partial [Fimbriimonadaceae bacterium]|nr:hypothetical protein [Fimbriimonadaceae bacterium]
MGDSKGMFFLGQTLFAEFLGQRVHTGDLGTIGVLVILEALLSADNALV